MYFKYKYFSYEKNKFIVFPLLFILIHTLHTTYNLHLVDKEAIITSKDIINCNSL